MHQENLEYNPEIERVVALINPYAKRLLNGIVEVGELVTKSGLEFREVFTDRDPAVTSKKLNMLEASDLLVVVGGDGTINQALSCSQESKALLLPTRSGNANDLAYAMNRKLTPLEIYEKYLAGDAHSVSVNPIVTTVEDITTTENESDEFLESEIISKLAINYASVGYAALASEYVNQPSQSEAYNNLIDRLPKSLKPKLRVLREGKRLVQAAIDSEHFLYTNHDATEQGYVADISFIYSSRMAKFTNPRADHESDLARFMITEDPGVFSALKTFISLTRSKPHGNMVSNASFQVKKLGGVPLFCQVDGEAFPLPDVCNVDFSFSPDPVRILRTTRPRF